MLLCAVIFALTFGSLGSSGRDFITDLTQANVQSIGWALLGGGIFNLSNILLVGAVDIAGLSVAFPLAIGIALVIATITNYVAVPTGDPYLLFIGVACVIIALVADALAYKKLPSESQKTPVLGFVLSIAAGITMGFFTVL